MYFILSQIMGIIALIIIAVSYFSKNKKFFLFLQIFANFFYALSFIFVNAFTAGINTFISIVKVVCFYFYEKVNKKAPLYFVVIFIVCYITVGIIFYRNILDIIPIVTAIIFSFAFWIRDMVYVRFLIVFPNLLLIFYSIMTQAYTSALLSVLEISVIVIAILKDYFERRKINYLL